MVIDPIYTVYALMAITGLVSYKGFNDPMFQNRGMFDMERILRGKEYDRIITSGFLHADWTHLGFNMLTLYFFGPAIVYKVGIYPMLGVYFASLIGGNLLTILLHQSNLYYRALGASGAVSGVLLMFSFMYPDAEINFFIPAKYFALLYIAGSIYAIYNNNDNIGHSAHLGGAIIGLLSLLIFDSSAINENSVLYFAVLIPCVLFLLNESGIIKNFSLGDTRNPFKKKTLEERHHRGNEINPKIINQKELDRLLEKISDKGIESLTKEEKDKLDQLSK